MKSLARRVFLGVTLLLALVTAVFWGRSHTYIDQLYYFTGLQETADDESARNFLIGSANGQVWFTLYAVSDRQNTLSLRPHIQSGLHALSFAGEPAPNLRRRWWEAIGFGVTRSTDIQRGETELKISAPHWFVLVLFILPTSVGTIHWTRKRKRYRSGCCQTCGYDLRASSDRCPECGQKTGSP